MSSYKYKDFMFGEKEENKSYLMTQVDTSYGGNGLAPVYSPAGNGGGLREGTAIGGNASGAVDDTYVGNGAIPGEGAAVGGTVPGAVASSTGNGGGSVVQPVDSYAKFAEYFERMRQNSVASAEATRKNTYRIAEEATERAMVDAQNSYRQNLSGYGARGEALVGAGLAGSGYADYLDSKAYATMRGEVQAARAQEFAAKQNADYIEGQAKLDADNSYQANMFELEKAKKTEAAQKQTNYQTVLGNAHSGVYATVDAAKDAAAAAGLDETQKAAVLGATQKYIDRLQYANNEEVAAALGDDIGVIQNKVLGGKLSPEQGQEQIYKILFEQYEDAIASGAEFDASRVDALTGEWKDKFVKLYNERYETSDKLFLKSEDGYTFGEEYVTPDEAKSILTAVLADPLLSTENKQKIQAVFDKRYSDLFPQLEKATNFDGPKRVNYVQATASGNYGITMENGEVYYADIDFVKPADEHIQNFANSGRVENKSVFLYRGLLYYRAENGTVYEVSASNGYRGKDKYADLANYIGNSMGG